ncbi:hypothetical protein F5Y08DRAFT_350636 [Xylaria arbuscula]|nr:hypothetical protein F5Y08DRAFT_350636 [Xylaria arbuscula]
MRRLPILSVAVLFHFAAIGSSQLNNLVTIKDGEANGGCDSYRVELDNWYEEARQSLESALAGIADYNENTPDGLRVRKAMYHWFRIPMTIKKDGLKQLVIDVAKRLSQVADWLDGKMVDIPQDKTLLFCNSDFLVQKDANKDEARDYQGKIIKKDDKDVLINQIAAYADVLGGNIPWWSGQYTDVNGYYFTSPKSGGKYCASEALGLTATLMELTNDGVTIPGQQVQTIVICPYAFNTPLPRSYSDAVAMIDVGSSLATVVPRSATLLHEAFHVVFGTGMLQGAAETYGLAECLEVGRANVKSARLNPENYVYFVAAMHFLYGDTAGVMPPNWDFATDGPNKAKKYS